MNTDKTIAIGADHAGYEYKELLRELLKNNKVKDYGTFSSDSVDYPDFAHPVATAVEKGESAFGILLCGSANGVAMTANKHEGIRAAICWNQELAELARSHNDANVLCIPARYVSAELARDITTKFLNTPLKEAPP